MLAFNKILYPNKLFEKNIKSLFKKIKKLLKKFLPNASSNGAGTVCSSIILYPESIKRFFKLLNVNNLVWLGCNIPLLP